jgi:tRNA A37 threonylcarbamoyladenosine synthetase subunit TsaC/SUA5/YrdC
MDCTRKRNCIKLAVFFSSNWIRFTPQNNGVEGYSYSDSIQEAKTLLQNGDVVAIPTETVYGLAANALNATAVAKIFEAKNRPFFDPLIVHVASVEEAEKYVQAIPAPLLRI